MCTRQRVETAQGSGSGKGLLIKSNTYEKGENYMTEWQKLKEFLRNIPETNGTTVLSFSQIETIIQGKLPPSSSKRWFWANTCQRHYAKFWLGAGWRVKKVDLGSHRVVFVLQTQQQSEPDRGRAGKRSVTSVLMPSKYTEIKVSLSAQEFEKFGELKTADKAIEIVKKHLQDKYGSNIEIHVGDTLGADIRIVFKNEEGREELIEVKGTKKPNVAWSQLKVSSKQSHENLQKGIPLYRVIDVDSKTPRILILKYGRDFIMEPEHRWAVKPVRS
jgi:hypothetical protein